MAKKKARKKPDQWAFLSDGSPRRSVKTKNARTYYRRKASSS